MSDEEFEALVARLQVESAAHPRLYRLRVVFLAAMGYGFLVGAVIALVLITIGLLYILVTAHIGAISAKLLAPLAALVFIMVRALWVTVPKPVGMSLTAERAPGLFALLQEVREQVNGSVIHQVLLDGDFNAAILRVPCLGVLGWQQNFLVLGLPLMQMLPTPEFRSVLVHEMGHLVGSHGRFGIWIYRQRDAWSRLLAQLQAEKRAASVFFSGFLKWYSPLFNAYTFVMARAHEYDADSLAAQATSPRVTADALTRIAILSGWIDQEFWGDIQHRTRVAPLPPEDLFSEMAGLARVPADRERMATALATVLASQTGSADTHPSLRARLEALHETARPPAPFEVSAAAEVLGDALPVLAGELNRKWYDTVVEHWKQANSEADAQRKRLAELEALDARALSPEERWERGRRRTIGRASRWLRPCAAAQDDGTQPPHLAGTKCPNSGAEDSSTCAICPASKAR